MVKNCSYLHFALLNKLSISIMLILLITTLLSMRVSMNFFPINTYSMNIKGKLEWIVTTKKLEITNHL